MPVAIKLQAIPLIQATAAQATAARGLVTADTATMAAIVQVFQQATTEAAITVQLVQINLPIRITRATAVHLTAVLTAVTAVTVITAALTLPYPQDNGEAAKTARLVPMLLLMPITQGMAAQATVVLGLVTADTAITVQPA